MRKKILLIDDGLSAPGQFADCDILLARGGADAFERIYVAQPDLVLLDGSLPDSDAICRRLFDDPLTASIPVIVVDGRPVKYPNVVRQTGKDGLDSAVSETLALAKPKPNPAAAILSRDAGRVVFAGHTGFFSLRSALQMAYSDQLTGALRVFVNRFPVEVFFAKGRFLFATSRNALLYTKDSPVILSSTNLGLIVEAQVNQGVSGCPLFLYLAARSGFPHDDVVQIVRDHGQRLFAGLFTAGRVQFEFEETTEPPDYAAQFPPGAEDPDNWLLASLRYVKFDALTAQQRPDPNGNPNYTQRGYESIQRLRLNDVEVRFAAAINGASSLQQIAKKIGVALNDALLIVFRFQTLEIIDYWSSQVKALPPAQ